ncbi:hypothetical protein ACFSTC_13515 [Nonomuraea ferruginea]
MEAAIERTCSLTGGEADHGVELGERLLDRDLRQALGLLRLRLGPALAGAHPYPLLRAQLGPGPAGEQETVAEHDRGGAVGDPDGEVLRDEGERGGQRAGGHEREQRGHPRGDPADQVGGDGDRHGEQHEQGRRHRLRGEERGEERQQRDPARQDQHGRRGLREAEGERDEAEDQRGGEERVEQVPAERRAGADRPDEDRRVEHSAHGGGSRK